MYCTKCGRKLEEGEICTCSQDAPKMKPQGQVQQDPSSPQGQVQQEYSSSSQGQVQQEYSSSQGQTHREPQGQEQAAKAVEWLKEEGHKAAKATKQFFKDVVKILKQPVSETARMAEEDSRKNGLRFIIIKAVFMIVLALIIVLKLNNDAGGYLDVPYISLIVLILALTLGADCLETGLLKMISKLFGGTPTISQMYSVVGVRAVYDMVIVTVTLILSFISPVVAICACILAMLVLSGLQFAFYRSAFEGDENKKAYAYAITKICMIVIICIFVCAAGLNVLDSVSSGIGSELSSLLNPYSRW